VRLCLRHAIALCALWPCARPQAQTVRKIATLDSSILQSADSISKSEFERDRLGSITVALVAGPRVVWSKSYGFADSLKTRPADVNTVYRAASISKQLTALMLLDLADRGIIGLSDPVERYVPEIRRVKNQPSGAAPAVGVAPSNSNQPSNTTHSAPSAPSPRKRFHTKCRAGWSWARGSLPCSK